MTWAAKRRTFIVLLLVVVIGGLAFWHYSATIFVAPTCSDGKQNGDERGVDCGGTMCSIMCRADVSVPTVLWARAFPVTSDVYNAAAYIENKNASATRAIAYEFRIYDPNDILIVRRDGVALVPPLGNYAIVETGLQTGNAVVGKTTFAFSSTPAVWERVPASGQNLRVSTAGISLDTTGTIPKLSAVIGNPSPTTTLQNTVVAAVLYDANDNAISVSRTVIPTLAPQTATPIVFTWPHSFSTPIVRTEILPIIDVFHAK